MTRTFVWLHVIVAALFLSGCGGSRRVAAPDFDPVQIASGAIAEHDTDSSGTISKAEAKKSPFSMDRWDSDGDGEISETEIQERLEKWVEKRSGLMDVTCQVTLNRRPVENAIVEFVPYEYLNGVVEAAEATTNYDGVGRTGHSGSGSGRSGTDGCPPGSVQDSGHSSGREDSSQIQ